MKISASPSKALLPTSGLLFVGLIVALPLAAEPTPSEPPTPEVSSPPPPPPPPPPEPPSNPEPSNNYYYDPSPTTYQNLNDNNWYRDPYPSSSRRFREDYT